jgi:LCP family protein required for cell wall assembly
MPDRPDQPAQPDGGQHYDWLYDGAGSAGTPPPAEPPADGSGPDPEHTQVLPTASRPNPGATEAAVPAARPEPATGGADIPPPLDTGRRGPRFHRPRLRRVIPLILVIWLAFLIAVPLWAWGKVDKIDAIPSSGPANQPGTNYLLVGSDSREGLSKAENRKLGTGGVGVDGGRTDTIMILHTGSGPSMLLSIPRDSLVPIPGHGTTKINAAYAYGGPKLLVKTIQQDTGLHIDHYVEIGLGGFVNIVDAVGGVEICPKTRVVDRRANLNVKKGCQTANGATALGWARSRHAFATGDIEREQHQREIVNQIGHKAKSAWTVLNPWRYFSLSKAATTSLKVSKGTTLFNMADFAWAMGRVNGKNGLTCGMPIANLSVQWDHTRALKLLSYLKADKTSDLPKALCTKNGMPK